MVSYILYMMGGSYTLFWEKFYLVPLERQQPYLIGYVLWIKPIEKLRSNQSFIFPFFMAVFKVVKVTSCRRAALTAWFISTILSSNQWCSTVLVWYTYVSVMLFSRSVQPEKLHSWWIPTEQQIYLDWWHLWGIWQATAAASHWGEVLFWWRRPVITSKDEASVF